MNKDHKNKFNTPEGYFEKFNERLFARIENEEEEPNTDFLPATDGFRTPPAYFEEFNTVVQEKLNGSSGKVISLRPSRTFYYAAAAIAALLVVAIGWNWQQTPSAGFEDFASAEIATYLEDNDLGISSYELAEVVNLESFTLEELSEKAFEEETILEYLDENVEDLEDLDIDYEALEY